MLDDVPIPNDRLLEADEFLAQLRDEELDGPALVASWAWNARMGGKLWLSPEQILNRTDPEREQSAEEMEAYCRQGWGDRAKVIGGEARKGG